MKRIFLSVCAVAAVMFFMESCQKEVPVVDNTPSVISPDDGTDDEPEPDPADLLPIKIDAEFADWEALDASKVAETVCAEGASKTALKKMRVYADDDYIWMYFEIDETQLQGYCYQPGKYASWGPTFWQYAGTPGKVEWKWDNIAASGIGTGAGKDGKYELQIMRVIMVDVKFADTFTVGVDLQQNWASIGVLPNAAGGAAEKLAVTIDKK